MQHLILFRGLPGSGKSALAQLLCDVVLSADDYHIQPDGSYCYDPARIRDAHRQCQSNVTSAIRLGIQRIGVANTFTQQWEIDPYYEIARQYGIQIHSLIVENRHGSLNTHGVPDSVIDKMRSRFSVVL